MAKKDPVLHIDQEARDVEIPEDIVIASYANLKDRGRYEVRSLFGKNSSKTSRAGVANKGQSVLAVVNKAVSENRVNSLRSVKGTTSGTSESDGTLVIAHGATFTPDWAMAVAVGAADVQVNVVSVDATNLTLEFRTTSTGAVVNAGSVEAYWEVATQS